MDNSRFKFRAWDNGEMHYMPLDSNFGRSRFFGFIPEDAILEQFTGMHDKNGVEIYEGDVVKWGFANQSGDVYYEKGAFRVRCYYCSSQDNPCDAFGERMKLEVIGNIHESEDTP